MTDTFAGVSDETTADLDEEPLAVSDDGEPNRRDLILSIEKGMAVIRVFSSERRRCTLADVARETGLSRAASRRMLITLQTLGYIGSEGREYFLLPRVLDLGYNLVSSAGLTGLVQPHLDQLSDDVAEGVSLGILSQGEVVYIASAKSRRFLTAAIGLGARFNPFTSAAGRVLLSDHDDEANLSLAKENAPPTYTRYTVTEPDLLLAEIHRVREQGWSVVAEELEIGFCAAAVPLRSPDGEIIAALNVGSHSSRVTPQQATAVIVPKLRVAAAAIERDLSLHPQPF